MHPALALLSGLDAADHAWLFAAGRERHVTRGHIVIQEGGKADSVFLVLDGVLDLRMEHAGDRVLARLGSGELVGEISFLTGDAPSASVVAAEDSLLLVLARRDIESRMASDVAFAARLYRAFALLAARRLRERVSELATPEFGTASDPSSITETVWRNLDGPISRFKDLLAQVDAEALRSHEAASLDQIRVVDAEFTRLWMAFDDLAGDRSSLPEAVRQEIGRRVQREFLPYLLLSENAERYYAKPRGYAGDFYTIEKMYEAKPEGTGRLGPVIDACFLNVPTAVAVRNRRGLLASEIRAEIDAHPDRAARVLSLACGPAREVFDVYEQIPDTTRLAATLLDIDYQALAFVSDRRDRAGLRKQMRLERGNLVYLALGRQRIELEPQDFVYSIGLIDYFEDLHVIGLMNYIHGLLAPGGRVMLGNFHSRNRCKAFLDHVLEWRLVHRTEDDMNRLFAASAFGRPCTRILFEEQQINLFAECVKG